MTKRESGADDEGLETIDLAADKAQQRSPIARVQRGKSRSVPGAPRSPSSKSKTLVLMAAAAMVTIVVGVTAWQLGGNSTRSPRRAVPLPVSQRTVVPNVIGMSPWDAAALLARWGLANSVYERDHVNETSRVFAQEPGAGQGVRVGSIVGLRTKQAVRVARVSQGCVVFSRGGPDGGLHVLAANGALRLITKDAGDDQAAWSPDGTKIAFNRYIKGEQNVYLMHTDGSGVTQLTTGGNDASPTWSADGSRILFTRGVPGRSDFYTIKPDGTGLQRLTKGRPNDATPAWSPDGSTIAFVGSGSRTFYLYVMHAAGSGRKHIGGDLNAAWPHWSPDGRTIAVANEDDGSIQLISPDGSHLRKVFDVTTLPDATAPNFTKPAWSPDGTKLIFAAGNPQTSHLYIVNVDGSGIEQLTTGPVTDESPAWSLTPNCR